MKNQNTTLNCLSNPSRTNLGQDKGELVDTIRSNTSIDWTVRENVQAKMRIAVKRILRKHGYPPDMQERATETVLEQAKTMADWINKETKSYQLPPRGELGLAAEE